MDYNDVSLENRPLKGVSGASGNDGGFFQFSPSPTISLFPNGGKIRSFYMFCWNPVNQNQPNYNFKLYFILKQPTYKNERRYKSLFGFNGCARKNEEVERRGRCP